MNNFLNKIGLLITNGVATMYCAIIFACIALISLPAALKTHSLIVIVGWVAQTFLQLVLLSIIMVGQKLQSEKVKKHIDKKQAETHEHINFHFGLLHKKLKEKK